MCQKIRNFTKLDVSFVLNLSFWRLDDKPSHLVFLSDFQIVYTPKVTKFYENRRVLSFLSDFQTACMPNDTKFCQNRRVLCIKSFFQKTGGYAISFRVCIWFSNSLMPSDTKFYPSRNTLCIKSKPRPVAVWYDSTMICFSNSAGNSVLCHKLIKTIKPSL